VIADESPVSEYASYLALEDILGAQRPCSSEHDEMMFILAHQVHELWFKELLGEFAELQRRLADGDSPRVQHTLRRSVIVFQQVMSPIDVLATLTPQQFAGFRAKLGSASGFQSAQFREIEAMLGRRDPRMYDYFPHGSLERARIEAAMARPSLFASLLGYLASQGYPVPPELLDQDVSLPLEPSAALQDVLLRVYLENGTPAQVCEGFVEIDQGIQEWRYRHVALAERIIGGKPGTGGSSGVSYLRRTLFQPMFPDLWAVRSQL
jgi:tryptophan 2,3-dioxygenase